MTDKRKEELLRRAFGCISRLESGRRLYGCLHDSMGMANTEIEEAGYTLWEYYEEDTPEHMAAASGRQYAALEAWEWRLKTAVERTVQDGLRNTVNGNWKIPYAELKKESGLCLYGDPSLQEILGDMLAERAEVLLVSTGKTCFDVTFCPEYCAKIQKGKESEKGQQEPEKIPVPVPLQTLRCLIASPFLEVCLTSEDGPYKEPTAIPELCIDMLTAAGKEEWADVLDAEVGQIYMGMKGLEVSLAGVSTARLEAFSSAMVGRCPEELYEKWVAGTEEIYQARMQQMKR